MVSKGDIVLQLGSGRLLFIVPSVLNLKPQLSTQPLDSTRPSPIHRRSLLPRCLPHPAFRGDPLLKWINRKKTKYNPTPTPKERTEYPVHKRVPGPSPHLNAPSPHFPSCYLDPGCSLELPLHTPLRALWLDIFPTKTMPSTPVNRSTANNGSQVSYTLIQKGSFASGRHAIDSWSVFAVHLFMVSTTTFYSHPCRFHLFFSRPLLSPIINMLHPQRTEARVS